MMRRVISGRLPRVIPLGHLDGKCRGYLALRVIVRRMGKPPTRIREAFDFFAWQELALVCALTALVLLALYLGAHS